MFRYTKTLSDSDRKLIIKFDSQLHNCAKPLRLTVSGEGVETQLVHSCLCRYEPSGISSTRDNSHNAGRFMCDNYVDPSLRLIHYEGESRTIATPSADNSWDIMLDVPAGGVSHSLILLIFELSGVESGIFHVTFPLLYDTVGHVNARSCFSSVLSPLEYMTTDPFLNYIVKSIEAQCSSSTEQSEYATGTNLIKTLNRSRGENYQVSENILASPPISTSSNPALSLSAVHFVYGPKEGSQYNTLTLDGADARQLISAKSFRIIFTSSLYETGPVPIYEISSEQGAQTTSIRFVTPPLNGSCEGPVEAFIHLFIDDQIVDKPLRYVYHDSIALNRGSLRVNNLLYQPVVTSPVLTVLSIRTLMQQQWIQSRSGFETFEEFVHNFRLRFSDIVDCFGFNLSGLLGRDGGVRPAWYSDDQDATMVTQREDQATDTTNLIVDKLRSNTLEQVEFALSNMIYKMNLSTQMTTPEVSEQIDGYLKPKVFLENNFKPGKRHTDSRKPSTLVIRLVIYDANDGGSQGSPLATPSNLKVGLIVMNNLVVFDETTHTISVTPGDATREFVHQIVYNPCIATYRRKKEVFDFLTSFADFSCKWNGSLFYEKQYCNTGHYIVSLLKYLSMWEPEKTWAKFCMNVAQCQPLDRCVEISEEFFLSDHKGHVEAMIKGEVTMAHPRLRTTLLNYLAQEGERGMFTYEFTGNDDQSRREIESFCHIVGIHGKHYFKTESGLKEQRLLNKIIKTNYGPTISEELWSLLKPSAENPDAMFKREFSNIVNFQEVISPDKNSCALDEALEKAFKKTHRANTE